MSIPSTALRKGCIPELALEHLPLILAEIVNAESTVLHLNAPLTA
jgi:hypothetical protein